MKSLVIKTKNSDVITFDVEDIESMSFEDYITIPEPEEVFTEPTPTEFNLTADEIDNTPTISEPIVEEEVVEEEMPIVEETIDEVIEEVNEEEATIPVTESVPVQDIPTPNDIVSHIVDMVTSEPIIEDNLVAKADEPAVVVEIPNAPIAEPMVENLTEKVEEEPKKPVVDAGFTMV